MVLTPTKNKQYLNKFLSPIRICKNYKPSFGNCTKLEGCTEKGVSLDSFKTIYGSDFFYSCIGLDCTLMYTAHKAAGGMTSIYRQIGIGCERLFRQILIDTAEYESPELAEWKYETTTQSGKVKTLTLDGRLELKDIKNTKVKAATSQWMQTYCQYINATVEAAKGIVFEVRQGYKSKDSKRQNADIDNATVAWANGYLPIFAIFSSQIDSDLVLRYKNNRCGILIGDVVGDSKISLYSFCSDVSSVPTLVAGNSVITCSC